MADTLEFVVAFAIAFLMTFLIIPWLTPKLKAKGIVGRDLNKPNRPEIAEMGGIAVVIGFFAGVSALLAVDGVTDDAILNISLSVVLGSAFIGMIDDMFELSQLQKAFFPFLLALPLGAALDPIVTIPYLGELHFGNLMIITGPFAITCAANAGNMLEGFNGLGAGLGVIMSATLIALAIHHNRLDGVYLLIPLLGGLLAFLWFNSYPASIFPGDTLMLFMGATIAAAGLLSELHLQTTILFLPMIIEFFLKSRGRFRGENYATSAADGHLQYQGRIESITHVFMRNAKVSEKRLVAIIWGIEAILCAFIFLLDVSL